jgi:UrcA family protein
MTRLTTCILTVAFATVSQFAHADTKQDTPNHMLVHYADLDLTGPAGVSALYGRLRSAARQICAPFDTKDRLLAGAFKQCIAEAMSRAVTQVDRPGLSAYYQAKEQGRNAPPIEVTSLK